MNASNSAEVRQRMSKESDRLIVSLLEEAKRTPHRVETALTERDLWDHHGPAVWEAAAFEGSPSFYPVYRQGNLYSYSPLTLMLRKGELDLDPEVAKQVGSAEGWTYCSSRGTLDRDISRVGGPLTPGYEIRSPEEYALAVAAAMRADALHIERRHPGFTNIILCGGRDSLNALVVPWTQPVLAVSAEPNFGLVKEFMRCNGLAVETRLLTDDSTELLDAEVLINACRNDLTHCRWGPALREIAEEFDRRVIFWKGQLGGQALSFRWRHYPHPNDAPRSHTLQAPWLRSLTRLTAGRGEYFLRSWMSAARLTQRETFRNYWRRGAMWQGAHNSIVRQLTGALTLSIYHGPAMVDVLGRVDLHRSVPLDVRDRVGEILAGRPVRYPEVNPGPPRSWIRAGRSHLAAFLEGWESIGLRVAGRSVHGGVSEPR